MLRIERRLALSFRRANPGARLAGFAIRAGAAAGALAGALAIAGFAMAEGSPPDRSAAHTPAQTSDKIRAKDQAKDQAKTRAKTPAIAAPPASAVGERRLSGPYPIEVLRVVDGDTFVARAQVWPGLEIVARVRLRDVDAPELGGRCARERRLAGAARHALADVLASGRPYLRNVSAGKYAGRVISSVEVASFADGHVQDVGAMLLAAGYVQPWRGRRANWCAQARTRQMTSGK